MDELIEEMKKYGGLPDDVFPAEFLEFVHAEHLAERKRAESDQIPGMDIALNTERQLCITPESDRERDFAGFLANELERLVFASRDEMYDIAVSRKEGADEKLVSQRFEDWCNLITLAGCVHDL